MLRALNSDDQEIIWEFLVLAAHETSRDAVRNAPLLARYAENWGRAGDFGHAAFLRNPVGDETVAGAIWARSFPPNQPGFGFISADIPEISLAVRPEFGRQGIGNALLNALIEQARTRAAALSLSVRHENEIARRIYDRAGFQTAAGSEVLNRIGQISCVMRLDLH